MDIFFVHTLENFAGKFEKRDMDDLREDVILTRWGGFPYVGVTIKSPARWRTGNIWDHLAQDDLCKFVQLVGIWGFFSLAGIQFFPGSFILIIKKNSWISFQYQ